MFFCFKNLICNHFVQTYCSLCSKGVESIKKTRQIREMVILETKFKRFVVLRLLLLVAQLELKIKDFFRKVCMHNFFTCKDDLFCFPTNFENHYNYVANRRET